MKTSKFSFRALFAFAALLFVAMPLSAQTNPPPTPISTDFHPVVTDQNVIVGWYQSSDASKTVTTTPPTVASDTYYPIYQSGNSGPVRGYVLVKADHSQTFVAN